MKCTLFLLLILNIGLSHADFTRGEGRFYASDDDNHQFIKSQLIYQGFKNILSKEIEKIGLNKELFWNKYNEKLEVAYTERETSLREKYKITPESSPKEKQNFQKRLRKSKLLIQRKFGKLDNIVPKYAIKKVSRSQQNSKLRFIRMEGEVNIARLTKLYYTFVKGKSSSEYGTLFINANFDRNKFSYSDLGIDNDKDFEDVVLNNWLEWFEKNKPQNIANVEIFGTDKQSKLQDYQKLPYENMLANVPEVFVNSLFLDIEVSIEKTRYNEKTKEFSFSYAGSAYLKDLQTNLIINTYKFNSFDKTYRDSPDVKLANVVATHVYGMAKDNFLKVQGHIKNLTPINSIQRMVLTDYRSIDRVNDFITLLESRGIKYSIRAKVDSIGMNRADIIAYYDGKETDLKALLSSLQSAKKDLPFELVDSSSSIGIKFKSIVENL